MPRRRQPTEQNPQPASPSSIIERPRLTKLVIKNYRCIGPTPVEIDLDDIVVLVGPNNSGKSSILKAYELAMSQGSKNAKLELDDFPRSEIDPDNLPEIEAWTVVYDDVVGAEWIDDATGERIVREKWTWSGTGDPKRQGWNIVENAWSERVPWGAPNIANHKRPEPHRVNAFDSPDDQAKIIVKLIMGVLEAKVKNINADESHNGAYNELLENVKRLQQSIVESSLEEINQINNELSSLVTEVFPGYQIGFNAHPEDDIEKSVNLFRADAKLLMGETGSEYMGPIDKQGSGARRALLWTTLKFIKERERQARRPDTDRPHLLLVDEPEICLHPDAIRNACNTLYSLAEFDNWQVMLTTHSPIFIDFSKDNTTIIRVNKEGDSVKTTTVFKSSKVNLGHDDKENLKLLNICDPYVSEFLFGGKIIIVEGDTEYTAFSYIKKAYPDEYNDVHIIRARGKATICSLLKIINKFGLSFAVLHDSDSPTRKDGGVNPAWTINGNILSEFLSKGDGVHAKLLASIPNFEKAYLGVARSSEKPYGALKDIDDDTAKREIVKKLFDCLVNLDGDLPEHCVEWNSIEELQNAFNNKEEQGNESISES